MSDIAASERRLAAALDRIDLLLEHAPTGGSAAGEDSAALRERLDEARAENMRLTAEVQRLHAAPPAQPRRDDAGTGPDDPAGGRLAAANEALAAANRALIAAQDDGDGDGAAVRAAYEAEIESLRAARAAEIAAMGEIMTELKRLLGQDGAGTAGADAGGPQVAAVHGADEDDDVLHGAGDDSEDG